MLHCRIERLCSNLSIRSSRRRSLVCPRLWCPPPDLDCGWFLPPSLAGEGRAVPLPFSGVVLAVLGAVAGTSVAAVVLAVL
eukprot:6461517-Amphidinium_carterae.1